MAQSKINKLELTWIGKEDEPLAIEPRLLIENQQYSWGGGRDRHASQWETVAGQYAHPR